MATEDTDTSQGRTALEARPLIGHPVTVTASNWFMRPPASRLKMYCHTSENTRPLILTLEWKSYKSLLPSEESNADKLLNSYPKRFPPYTTTSFRYGPASHHSQTLLVVGRDIYWQ